MVADVACNTWGVSRVYRGMTDEEIYVKYRDELIRYATVLVGPSDAEDVLSSVVTRLYRSIHTDACDWNALGNPLVILERVQDDQHQPHWDTGEYYTTTPAERAFAPNESMPPGVEMDNVRVGPGYATAPKVGAIARVDVQVVADAPQWWRFSMWTESRDPGHPLVAKNLAINVVSQMFETIIQDSR